MKDINRLLKMAKRATGKGLNTPLFVCKEGGAWYIWGNGRNIAGPFDNENAALDVISEMTADRGGKTSVIIDDLEQ